MPNPTNPSDPYAQYKNGGSSTFISTLAPFAEKADFDNVDSWISTAKAMAEMGGVGSNEELTRKACITTLQTKLGEDNEALNEAIDVANSLYETAVQAEHVRPLGIETPADEGFFFESSNWDEDPGSEDPEDKGPGGF